MNELFTTTTGAVLGLIIWLFLLVLAITWAILPFILMGRLTRIQRSLDGINDKLYRQECRELNAAQKQFDSQPADIQA